MANYPWGQRWGPRSIRPRWWRRHREYDGLSRSRRTGDIGRFRPSHVTGGTSAGDVFDTVALGENERSSSERSAFFPGAEGAVVPDAANQQQNRFVNIGQGLGYIAPLARFLIPPGEAERVVDDFRDVTVGRAGRALRAAGEYFSTKAEPSEKDENTPRKRRSIPRPAPMSRYRERQSVVFATGWIDWNPLIYEAVVLFRALSPCRITGWRWNIQLDPCYQTTISGLPLTVLWNLCVVKEGENGAIPFALAAVATPFNAGAFDQFGPAFTLNPESVVIADIISTDVRESQSDYSRGKRQKVQGSSRVSRRLQHNDELGFVCGAFLPNNTNDIWFSNLTAFIEFFVCYE